MKFSAKDFVTIDQILREVTKRTLDDDYRYNNKGYYKLLIQNCLGELNYEIQFASQNFEVAVPDNLNVEIPESVFNIKEMYLFNGETCNIGTSQNVYFAKNYFTEGNGSLKRNKYDNEFDPFHTGGRGDPRIFARSANTALGRNRENLFFYNIQSGIIMLSESCGSYGKLFFTANTIPDIENDAVVPRFLRRVIVDYVSHEAVLPRVTEGPQWQALVNKLYTELNGARHESDGSWYKAESRVKQMDYKERQDMNEYWQRLYY